MSEEDTSGVKRRSVMKSIGVTSLGASGLTSVVSSRRPSFEGVVYDTLTQEMSGQITGTIHKKQDELNGSINIAGYTLPINNLRKIEESSTPRYGAILEEEQYQEDGEPLKVELVEHTRLNHHFSGTLTRPSDEFGRLGFTLVSGSRYDSGEVLETNTPDSRWTESPHSFSIPKQGIPTDTGSQRLTKILNEEESISNTDATQNSGTTVESQEDGTLATDQDVGTLADDEWTGSLSSSCNASSDWTAAAAITANGSSNEDWNQIAYNGTNVWKFAFHFRERPENLYQDGCTQDSETYMKPHPHNFKFSIYTASDEETSNLYFDNWDPQSGDSDGSSDNETNLLLDILGGVGGPYTAIGAAVAEYLVADNRTLSVNKANSNTNLTFDVPVKGDYSDLPQEGSKAKAAEVSVRVKSEYDSGNHSIKFMPKYTFSYKYSDENQCYDCYTYDTRYKTVIPESDLTGTFEATE